MQNESSEDYRIGSMVEDYDMARDEEALNDIDPILDRELIDGAEMAKRATWDKPAHRSIQREWLVRYSWRRPWPRLSENDVNMMALQNSITS